MKLRTAVLDDSLHAEIARLQSAGHSDPDTGGSGPEQAASHVSRLLKLLKSLESINDRTDGGNATGDRSSQDFELLVIAALREAECADLIEKSMEADLSALCHEVKRKDEALQARETALAEMEAAGKTRTAEIDESHEFKTLKVEHERLMAERDGLVRRLADTELTARAAERDAAAALERMRQQVSALTTPAGSSGQPGDPANAGSRRQEEEPTSDMESLAVRLQDAEARLAVQETEIKEKDRAVREAGIREIELGKLIQRLSSECEKLSAELCEKGSMASRSDGNLAQTFSAVAWRENLRRVLKLDRTPKLSRK